MFKSYSGAVVVFTGLLSIAFLGRSIRLYMWIGIAAITVGMLIFGLADALFVSGSADANGVVAGEIARSLRQAAFVLS